MSGVREGRPIWEGHRQRLRQRMEREGWDALRPHEMVELVLNYAVPRQDLSDVSRALVNRFGSVGGVFAADREALLALEGVTPTLAEWICVTGNLMRAYYDLHAESDIRLSCYQEVLAFIRPRLKAALAPGMWVAYADFDFNLITYSEFDAAAPWHEPSNIRRMMVEAINAGARYVYLVRRTGEAPPEMDGEQLASLQAVAETLRAADVELVDCVLAGRGTLRSLRMQGLLKAAEGDARQLALHERYVAEGPRD